MRQIVNNSVAYCSISLKFCNTFEHMTRDLLRKFKVKRSKVKVTASRNARKNSPNHNSAAQCLIALKIGTIVGYQFPKAAEFWNTTPHQIQDGGPPSNF